MKAMTLWQPWAQFMALGFKTIETRGRRINHRGDICIHAGQHQPPLSLPVRQRMQELGMDPDAKQPKGSILAVVELYDCRPAQEIKEAARAKGELELGNYQPLRFAYLTRNLRRLPVPVECRGFQALPWQVPDDVAAKVLAQVAALEDDYDVPALCPRCSFDKIQMGLGISGEMCSACRDELETVESAFNPNIP